LQPTRFAINIHKADNHTNEYTIFAITFIVVVVVSAQLITTVFTTSGKIFATKLRSSHENKAQLAPQINKIIKKIQ